MSIKSWWFKFNCPHRNLTAKEQLTKLVCDECGEVFILGRFTKQPPLDALFRTIQPNPEKV